MHEVNGSYNLLTAGAPNNLSEISGHPDTKWGGSVMAALQIKNIPTGAGDDIKVDVSYAKGEHEERDQHRAAASRCSAARARALTRASASANTDGVYRAAAAISSWLTAYGIRGAFNHNWDPYWSTSLFGGYAAVRYGGSNADLTSANGQWCANYNTAVKLANASANYSCNPDFNVSQLGLVTRWTPVKNLTFSAEVMWFHLDQKFTGSNPSDPDCSEADRDLRVQGPGRRQLERPRSAQLLILISQRRS